MVTQLNRSSEHDVCGFFKLNLLLLPFGLLHLLLSPCVCRVLGLSRVGDPGPRLSSPGSSSCCLEDQVARVAGLLPVMPPLSCVGIASLRGCAERPVLALSAAMLYRSAGICCCVSTRALILQAEPRVDGFLYFFKERGYAEAAVRPCRWRASLVLQECKSQMISQCAQLR